MYREDHDGDSRTQQVTREALDADLAHATGSDEFYRHAFGQVLFTQGVQAMAELAGAYWLIDAVASHIAHSPKASPRREAFQVWTLTPYRGGRGATLTMQADTNAPLLVRQRIEYTDFPLHDAQGAAQPFRLYAVANGDARSPMTILLPSEY